MEWVGYDGVGGVGLVSSERQRQEAPVAGCSQYQDTARVSRLTRWRALASNPNSAHTKKHVDQ